MPQGTTTLPPPASSVACTGIWIISDSDWNVEAWLIFISLGFGIGSGFESLELEAISMLD